MKRSPEYVRKSPPAYLDPEGLRQWEDAEDRIVAAYASMRRLEPWMTVLVVIIVLAGILRIIAAFIG